MRIRHLFAARFLVGALAPFVAGCGAVSPNYRFEPMPETGTFSYTVLRTDADHPTYEYYNRDLLTRFVAANHLCPNGYDLVERKVVQVPASAAALAFASQDIYYRGRCK